MSPAAVAGNHLSDHSQPKNQQERKPKVQTEEEEEEEEVKIPLLFNNFEGFAD
jgi:ribosomal protein L12E/L44/L45/RPP1/RPP2